VNALSASASCKTSSELDFLCERFWMDWETAPQILNLFEESAIFAEQADPLVLRALL